MKKTMIIHSFVPVLPSYSLPQKDLIDWILSSHAQSKEMDPKAQETKKWQEKLKRFTLDEKHIEKRFFECNEIDEDWKNHEIYNVSLEHPSGKGIEARNHYFKRRALRVFESLYETRSPAHLIHVTCTGYISPSPPQAYFSLKKVSPTITHAYHMGCYAALPAIRMGEALAERYKEDVDIVHTEMCSLHLDPSMSVPEQMVVQTLFADGHIKYSVGQEASQGFVILGVHEKLIPDSLNDMTWVPGSYGMKMTLSREVPFKIRDALPEFVHELCKRAEVSVTELLQEGIFAIHPGGPKIIEAVQRKLELKDEQVKYSKKVLFERGNMSSATLPHVWNEILKDDPQPNKLVLSLAFGPGLTIFGALFEIKNP